MRAHCKSMQKHLNLLLRYLQHWLLPICKSTALQLLRPGTEPSQLLFIENQTCSKVETHSGHFFH